MKKILLFAILGMFLLSFASASSLPSYEVDELLDVKIYCQDIGYCESSVVCNINIEDPNGNLIVTGQDMQNQTTFYNYTILPSELGKYEVRGVCSDGTLSAKVEYDFNITPTGFSDDSLWFNMVLIFILIAGCLWTVNEYGEKSQNDDNQIYYYLSAFLLMVIGVITYFFGIAGYTTLITQALSLIVWGLGLFFMIKPWFSGREWHF